MRGQSGYGVPKKRKLAKRVAKTVENGEKLVLIQTGGGKRPHAFDPSYGQPNLVHFDSNRVANKQAPIQKPQLPRIVQLKADGSRQLNTIPSQRLVSAYL